MSRVRVYFNGSQVARVKCKTVGDLEQMIPHIIRHNIPAKQVFLLEDKPLVRFLGDRPMELHFSTLDFDLKSWRDASPLGPGMKVIRHTAATRKKTTTCPVARPS